jgi:hypothetical protein
MSSYELIRFDPSKVRPFCTYGIIGPRNTGKSILLVDLLQKTQKNTDIVIAMTATMSTAKEFKKFLPKCFVFSDGYATEKADLMVAAATRLTNNEKHRSFTLIMDDLAFDPRFFKSKTQSNLSLNGRHMKSSTFATSQYVNAMPPLIRSNLDYVICTKETTRINRKKLYDNFFGMFPSFKDFNKVFDQVTKNFGVLVLDRTTNSGNLSDQVKFYRADPKIKLRKLGKKIFYRLNDMLNDAETFIQQNNLNTDTQKINV